MQRHKNRTFPQLSHFWENTSLKCPNINTSKETNSAILFTKGVVPCLQPVALLSPWIKLTPASSSSVTCFASNRSSLISVPQKNFLVYREIGSHDSTSNPNPWSHPYSSKSPLGFRTQLSSSELCQVRKTKMDHLNKASANVVAWNK